MYWIVAIIIIGAVSAFLVWASADVASNVYIKTLCRGRNDERVVALTFDDGPDEQMTPRVLDVLNERNIKATFFLVGEKVERHPELVQRMVAEGHIVANHTYSHKSVFPMSKSEVVVEELQRCNDAIAKHTSKRSKLFRPPFGVTNPIIAKAVKHKNLTTIGWSIRSLDTVAKHSRESVCHRVVSRLHDGAVILLHDRCEKADVLLRILIEEIEKRGYKFVALNEIFNIEVYEN